MLTDTTLRSAVEALWDKLWAGGLANPLDAMPGQSREAYLSGQPAGMIADAAIDQPETARRLAVTHFVLVVSA